MPAPARTCYLGLDATDLHVAQSLAAAGEMPALAELLATAAVVETVAPVGYFVGSNWPTIYTGTTSSRHGFLCGGRVRGGTYVPEWRGPVTDPPALWQHLSGLGMRVAVLDAPHAPVAEGLNGTQLVEWGCHDRHGATGSWPRRFVEEVAGRFGAHPVGTADMPERVHYAPCDHLHRAGVHRSAAENAALRDDLLEGVARKTACSVALLEEGGWDLFFGVMGEGHCAGHQFWALHDAGHPWHDAAMRAEVGDPLRDVYRALDAAVGAHLARMGPDGTVVVHLSHGMRAHFDGTNVLDAVLWRLDRYASGDAGLGPLTRASGAVAGRMPARVRSGVWRAAAAGRRRLAARVPYGRFEEPIPWLGTRRWWAQLNDTVCGSVRLNLEGREPFGRVAARHRELALAWLADRLRELVNVDTGEPAVAEVLFTDDHYLRTDGDSYGDLIVEWNRRAPIDTVWSPATGVVHLPYEQWRTGDHHRGGLLAVRGPGIRPGRRPGTMPVLHVAPTLAATLGVEVPDHEAPPWPDLVPTARRRAARTLARPLPEPRARAPRRWSARHDVPRATWLERFALGLADTLHHVDAKADAARADAAGLGARVRELERAALVARVSAWLRHLDVPEKLAISVVVPTRNRRELLGRAIESVQDQSYRNWQLLVVDDGSEDDTPELLDRLGDDPRIVTFRLDRARGASAARNLALDHATGDVVVYLDDDCRFHPDWCKAVAWAFTERPDASVGYGARLVDDEARHHGTGEGGLPALQFLPWDPDELAHRNLVDQNVLAHRRRDDVRFDEALHFYSDWDLLLRLTADRDPIEIPAVAVYYATAAPDRLSARFGDDEAAAQFETVRSRARRWRATR